MQNEFGGNGVPKMLNGKVRDGDKACRRIKDDSDITHDFGIHHNYVRPHMRQDCGTPAYGASIVEGIE